MELIIKAFDQMQKKGIIPDEYAFHIVIDAYAKQGMHKEMLKWVSKMEKSGVKPTARTYTYVINSLSKFGKNEQLQDVLKLLPTKGIQPDLTMYHSILDSIGTDLGVDDVMTYMDSIKLTPNLLTFNKLLNFYSFNKDFKNLSRTLAVMSARGVVANVATYTNLVHAVWYSKYPEFIMTIYNNMMTAKVVPDVWFFEQVIEHFSRIKDIGRSQMMFFYNELLAHKLEPNVFIGKHMLIGLKIHPSFQRELDSLDRAEKLPISVRNVIEK
jgi:pentatricopeptide repeat protein